LLYPCLAEATDTDLEGNMPKNPLKDWEREFRSAANSDNLVLFRDHLKKLELPDKPKQLLEGTIFAVQACCAYVEMDGRSSVNFLAMQKYNTADAINATYAFTFDIFRKSFARILTSKKFDTCLDLADLYGFLWSKYKVCGYDAIWVSRTDWKALTTREKAKIEEEVTGDLRFDYSDDELGFWFDDETIKGVLRVYVYDVEEED
jgi:hypothetical protein